MNKKRGNFRKGDLLGKPGFSYDMKRRGILSNKRAAFEMSVTTMIVIVLAVVMLIMGLILIRNIFTGGIATFDTLQKKTIDEVNKLFTDENQKIVVFLGESKLAEVKAGTTDAGVLIAARTETGSKIESYEDMQYKLTLDDKTQTNCFNTLGDKATEALFLDGMDEWLDVSDFQGDTGKAIIRISVPEGTILCGQLVKLQVRDKTVNSEGNIVGGTSFTVQIKRSGLF